MLIPLFQGEMGSEGLRGLPGESGDKGAKVRFISPLLNFNLSLGIIMFYLFPTITQGDNGLPGPRGSPGAPGEPGRNVGENSHLGRKKTSKTPHLMYIKNSHRAPEVMQVMLDQEENLDHLDQRCVYLCTRIFGVVFF